MSETIGTTEVVTYEYSMQTGAVVAVRWEADELWPTQAQMAQMSGTTQQNIALHLRSISELYGSAWDSVHKEYLCTAADGKAYRTKHYASDVVIDVMWRVKSPEAHAFRAWARDVIKRALRAQSANTAIQPTTPPALRASTPPASDPLYEQVVAVVKTRETVSCEWLKRTFHVGSGRGQRIFRRLISDGIVELAPRGTFSRVLVRAPAPPAPPTPPAPAPDVESIQRIRHRLLATSTGIAALQGAREWCIASVDELDALMKRVAAPAPVPALVPVATTPPAALASSADQATPQQLPLLMSPPSTPTYTAADDALYAKAILLLQGMHAFTPSWLERKLMLGDRVYPLVARLEAAGVVSTVDPVTRRRRVLIGR